MKPAGRVIALAVALGVGLVNSGAMQAVHLCQHATRCNTSQAARPEGKGPAGNQHDPRTCSLCIHFASGHKTISPDLGLCAGFIAPVARSVVFVRTFSLPRRSLPSAPARAPPFLGR